MNIYDLREVKSQILRLYYSMLPLASMRVKFLRKHNIFAKLGENVHFQPRHYPADGYMLKIHNNVSIARSVNFIMHDISHMFLNEMNKGNEKFVPYKGCIEIYDNVFIGSGVQICPNVSIGPNAIIAAGAVVTKDVEPGTVVAGVPAKVVGDFETFVQKRLNYSKKYQNCTKEELISNIWDEFYSSRKKRG